MRPLDINKDGFADYYYKEGNCLWVLPSENGALGAAYQLHCGTSGEHGYYLTDADGDDDLDLFHGKSITDGLFYKENIDGDYQASVRLTFTGNEIFWITEADFNEDGIDDLVVLGDESYVGVVERTSHTSYGLTHTVASLVTGRHVDPVEIDTDEHDEISVFYSDWIGYLNPDSANFPGITTVWNSQIYVQDVDYADMDLDGDQDLIILFSPDVSPQKDTTMIWVKNENMRFTEATMILSDYHDGKAIVAFDFDQDNDTDIAVFSA
jgi:hypothetical protein